MQIFTLILIRKLKIDKLQLVWVVGIALASSFFSILIYDRYLMDFSNLYALEKQRAVAVAEKELLFSDRFSKTFTTAVPSDFIKAADISRKAVVSIRSNAQTNHATQSDYNPNINSGSGVILTEDGYIVTNNHVVNGSTKIEVTLNDNRVFDAKLIGTDPNTDIALLKIEAQQLDFLVFGNSDSLQIGEWVMAVGNPFRLQSTVTAGIVSAKARNINLFENQGIESFIQTDAAVNPGNSGGALINTKGDLVGVCTAILSQSGRYEGFSFAVPSNLTRKIVKDLKEYGVVQRGWLGIEIENINNVMADELGLDEVSGIFISSVTKGGGASDAGIRSNDVVVSVNANRISNTGEFMELLGRYRPGDTIDLTCIREKKKFNTKAILRNQLNSTDLISIREDGVLKRIGLACRDLDTYEKSIVVPNGVMVVSVKIGSIISQTKMEPGYIITRINNKDIHSTTFFLKMLENLKGKTVILEGFYPKYPGEYPYTFEMPE